MAFILGFMFFENRAEAQITGDLIEPNVMLIIDTSASMDWSNPDEGWTKSHVEWSIEQCEQANAGNSFQKTSWQQLLDTFLGEIDGDTYKCAIEPPVIRPSLHALSRPEDIDVHPNILDPFLEDVEPLDNTPDNVSEFRGVSWPHFRSISCLDEDWKLNDTGTQYQCTSYIEANSEEYDLIYQRLYEEELVHRGMA